MGMKFKIDENLPVEAARLLNDAGHDATTVISEGLSGKPDHIIAAACREEKRAIISLDMDFSDIGSYPPGSHEGLVVLRLRRQDRKMVMDVVRSILPLLGKEPVAGRLWIVEQSRIRIRE